MSSIAKFGYTLSHQEFYDSLDRYQVNEEAYCQGVRSVLPEDWRIHRNSIWFHCLAPNHPLLDQGWKIHVSAVTQNVPEVLNATLPILVRHGCSFKFAADPSILFLLVSKQWQRGGAGKFMTIYPRDDAHFRELIEELHQATRDLTGPYILSDRRYSDSKCVFYRYGGISGMSELTVKGDRYSYLLSPEGEKIPDRRQAFYHLPAWVKDPFETPAPAEPAAATPAPTKHTLQDGRYEIESSLRFSNTGGLYVAWDTKTLQKVVIKEARPKTNVDVNGTESTDFLRKEYRLLQKFAGEEVGPRPIDFFEEWEHSFLVMEFLDGMTIRQHSVLHNVTRTAQPTVEHIESFYEAFAPVFVQLTKIVECLGRHQVVFRDLSPTNVLILKDGQVRLVDFEAATELGVDGQSNLFTPGYASADIFASDTPNSTNDYFSVGALMFAYLMPIHAAMGLDDTIHERVIPVIGEEYGLPKSLVSLMLKLMSKNPEERPHPDEVISILENPSPVRSPLPPADEPLSAEACQELVDKISNYTLAQATYNRTDRLFPCDPTIFATNPMSLGYGACGIAYALSRLTGKVPDAVQKWILNAKVTPADYAPGLFLGMAGIAWALLELGHEARAKELLLASANHPLEPTYDLFYGLAGWGMTHLHFHQVTADPYHLEQAVSAGDRLVEARTQAEDGEGCYWKGPEGLRFGLGHGASGIALFLLYLHLATGEDTYLHVGREALDFDLARSVDMDGGLLWPSRTGAERSVVPYFKYGSVGIGAVLLRYNRLLAEPRYTEFLQGIKRAALRKYAIFPQKSFGLTSLGDFLIDMANHGIDEEECMAGAHTVAHGVLLFKLDREEGIAFPGADLWKISCDYLTGSSGIALFLQRLQTRSAPDFFLDDLFNQSEERPSRERELDLQA